MASTPFETEPMISHLLLDIEGTTCPVSFVSDVLFPYATQQLEAFIEQHHSNKDINKILQSAIKEHNQDNDWLRNNRAIGLLNEPSDNRLEITNYLKHLISIDKKSTALKDLQGKIWKHGYTRGDIVSTLFPETMTCLNQWRSMDLTLAVYS
ncbi:MAG: acireductone synthase, partial [Synechococcus sp.]